MIGDAVLYAASRATSSAVEHVSRRITWTALAATFMICGLVFALIAAYWFAVPRIGALYAGAGIAAGCILVGVCCLSVPHVVEWIERRRRRSQSAVAVVDEEAKEAVDYFGALQVVSAAFLFGLGAARRIKR